MVSCDRIHPQFVQSFGKCVEHIWGYRQLVHEVERLRTIQYDADDSSHEDKLLKLWGLLMPDVHLKSRVTKQWQEIGFQGDDPKTDFREEYPGPASHVLSHSHHPQYGYAFAIVGINLTFMAYHLLKDGLAKTHVYNVSKIFPAIKIPHFKTFEARQPERLPPPRRHFSSARTPERLKQQTPQFSDALFKY
uniref:ELMO domain-containing protein n=1 Tax=Timema tahoe TaxID=61484 RepID=A0A7R9IDM9_9NEOP|nr:unnamed protein product [Timema tahoe]